VILFVQWIYDDINLLNIALRAFFPVRSALINLHRCARSHMEPFKTADKKDLLYNAGTAISRNSESKPINSSDL